MCENKSHWRKTDGILKQFCAMDLSHIWCLTSGCCIIFCVCNAIEKHRQQLVNALHGTLTLNQFNNSKKYSGNSIIQSIILIFDYLNWIREPQNYILY